MFAASFEAALGLLALGLGWLFHCPPLAQFRWTIDDALAGVIAALPMLVLFFACLRWPIGPLRDIKQVAEETIRPLFAGTTILELAVIAFAAGLGEELLFRGLAQPVLARWLGTIGGVAVASLLFGLLHPMTITYIFLAGGIGIYLGWLALATQNLLAPIVAHAFYDWVALVVLLRRRPPLAPTHAQEKPHETEPRSEPDLPLE